jgi:hypothetical protein
MGPSKDPYTEYITNWDKLRNFELMDEAFPKIQMLPGLCCFFTVAGKPAASLASESKFIVTNVSIAVHYGGDERAPLTMETCSSNPKIVVTASTQPQLKLRVTK